MMLYWVLGLIVAVIAGAIWEHFRNLARPYPCPESQCARRFMSLREMDEHYEEFHA